MRLAHVALAVAVSLASLACSKDEPKSTRWDQAASAAASAAVAAKEPDAAPKPAVVKGGDLNKFFPADGVDGAKRAFTRENDGYAEAKFTKDGKEATLSISDTNNDLSAKEKFQKPSGDVAGNPLVTVGKNQSAILVKDRWQVKVSSMQLDENARKEWLGKFDLAGLAKL